ncbi:MAG: enoyl-CoA hydratase [Actinomycetia bacterium]|nr:enoyl-CoA hydratase [Actinomycetes bacterium]MCP4960758.1 enoyl-CoA hydratase [Actinomycetes bacterium]
MEYEQILTDLDDGILTVTMNRPKRLNAWTYQMGAEMADAIRKANADDNIEGILLTGAGRGFCAGADIEDVFKAQSDGSVGDTPRMGNWVRLIRESKPIVAAINGPAIGVGLTQVLPCDLLIAAYDAKLSARFVKMGVVPELASSKFLTLRCGFGTATELALTGRTVLGTEAAEIKLVDKAVPGDSLIAIATQCLRSITENPLEIVRSVKELLTLNATEDDLDVVMARESEALRRAYESPEHKEAIAAFIERRDPDFRAARRSR